MSRKRAAGYLAVLAASFTLAMVAGWLGEPIDNGAYDWMFRLARPGPAKTQSILLSIDEESLARLGGMRRLRAFMAEGLERVAAARPKAVVIDLILADEDDPEQDAALDAALAKLPGLVLSCDMVDEGRRWEHPLPRFKRRAAAVGHVHAEPTGGVCRQLPLVKVAGRERRWALALEAFRLSRGAAHIVESPEDLEVGGVRIPAPWRESRMMRIRYASEPVEQISFWELKNNPALAERFRDRVVFVGMVAQSAAADRFMTPVSGAQTMAGVEIHANAFETLAGGRFLVSASNVAAAALSLALAAAGVAAFAFRTGWLAYAAAAVVLGLAHLVPYWMFTRGIVYPFFAPVSAAWLSVVGAGALQFVTVRRQLRRTEAEKVRYQHAMHFVTHEMRTPLTAIQGSSELMSRYNLSEEKRKQIAELINSESKRLARMIETFLSVERLSAGQMQLKKEAFPVRDVLDACLARARPLAERKQIRLNLEEVAEAILTGDRELMEYAVYNLLTNAVKYSPAETVVTVSARTEGDHLRLSVKDQGIGMEQHELRKIFQKFYRTSRAEKSGIVGTGIGLSIVEQIVTHHGGRIEVSSAPGKGSCFTLVLPAQAGTRVEPA
ncbi:MAG TPA: CHASE2 and HATPase_c domain-containing protein [Bryobacteraceae bacterium]|nr:CHASE2 and HATPase_c domain-containing protein [Bryobacteraceae bacterium]